MRENARARHRREAEAAALDILFDPYTGSLWSSPDWDDEEARQEFEALLRGTGQDLYREDIDLWGVALAPLNNPLNEAVDNPEHPLHETVDSNKWMDTILILNANHTPYAVFLKRLDLKTDGREYPWNYEPTYLEALMLAHPDQLELAKQDYREGCYEELLEFIFDNGLGSTTQ